MLSKQNRGRTREEVTALLTPEEWRDEQVFEASYDLGLDGIGWTFSRQPERYSVAWAGWIEGRLDAGSRRGSSDPIS